MSRITILSGARRARGGAAALLLLSAACNDDSRVPIEEVAIKLVDDRQRRGPFRSEQRAEALGIGSSQRGHDLFQFALSSPSPLEDQVIDHREIIEAVEAKFGKMTPLVERSVFNPATNTSLRRRNSATIASGPSCGPVIAAMPARWVKLAVHELEFTVSLLTDSASQPGITP